MKYRMSKELKNQATIHYNNFLDYKKKAKNVFKNIIVHINNNRIVLSSKSKEDIKSLILMWNNTENYSGQDYINMRDISQSIMDEITEDLSMKELFKNYLLFFDKFQKDLYKFYEYVAQIEELEKK